MISVKSDEGVVIYTYVYISTYNLEVSEVRGLLLLLTDFQEAWNMMHSVWI